MQYNRLEKGCKLNNRYHILRCIGQGGFGITYMARDESFGQSVVIKEYFPIAIVSRDQSLNLQIVNEEASLKRYKEGMERFLSEAQILATLFDVPGVVKVLDYFKENDTAYIVMEHVKGISLRTYLERANEEISFERAWQMMQPVMKALEKIHQKGLLHRDINPDNLMIEEDGNIKLLDFGSAREYFLEQDREKTMTILVKNGYAPPEQYENKGKQGPWTDIYALCATMYEMMTGCMPPGAKERQVIDELYAPSTYDAAILPEQEELFLKKGMALEVSDRFSSIGKMMEAFSPEVTETKKKNKRIIAVSIVVVFVAVILAVWFWVTAPYQEEVQYAGNYERGSEEYDAFMQLVKENAVESESYELEDLTLKGIKYTLDEKTVQQIGLPGNEHRMDMKEDDILKSADNMGYLLELADEEREFFVYEEPFGTIRTEFHKILTYHIDEGYQLEICQDYFDDQITHLYISRVDGDIDFNHFAINLLKGVYPDIDNSDESVKTMDEALIQYKSDYLAGHNIMNGFRHGNIVYFYRMYKETGDQMFLKVVSEYAIYPMPLYNW